MNARTDEMAKAIWRAIEESGKTCERYKLAIGDGWYQFYYKLCNELQCIIDIHELDPKTFHFTTMKEKFLTSTCVYECTYG